jgi:NitT/TauT family transport system substrate-binding protein
MLPMKSLHPWRRRAMLAVAAALLLGSGLQARAENKKVSIVVSGFSAWFYLQQHVALGGKLYEAEGLTPDVIDTNSGTRQAAAVMGGSGEIGQFSFPHVIKSAANGGSLVAIGTGYTAYPIQLVISEAAAAKQGITASMPIDERIKRIKGLKIAISSPGASTDLFMRTIMIVRGMNPDKDVALQPVGAGAPQYSAFEAGAVDGFAFGSPFTDTAIKKHGALMVANPMIGEVAEFRESPYQIIATSRQTLATKRDVLEKALRALAKAQKMLREDPTQAKKLARPYFEKLSDEDYSTLFDANVGGVPKQTEITQQAFKATVDLMNLTETKNKFTLNFSDAVASELAQAADKAVPRKN